MCSHGSVRIGAQAAEQVFDGVEDVWRPLRLVRAHRFGPSYRLDRVGKDEVAHLRVIEVEDRRHSGGGEELENGGLANGARTVKRDHWLLGSEGPENR